MAYVRNTDLSECSRWRTFRTSEMGGSRTSEHVVGWRTLLEQQVRVEHLGQGGGHCDCCGNESRCVWGLVHDDDRVVAAYWMHWTVGHLTDPGANLDLVIGPWGDDAASDQRVAVSLLHREIPGDPPALMVIDAAGRPFAQSSLASAALARADVIGSPLAQTVFGLVDVIYEQDGRFF